MPAAAMHTPSRQPYSTKRIPCGRCSPTSLLQSTNGPCPLIAIANVLVLREELQFSKDVAPEALLPLLAHLMHQKAQTLGGIQENQQRCTMRCGDWTVCRMA